MPFSPSCVISVTFETGDISSDGSSGMTSSSFVSVSSINSSSNSVSAAISSLMSSTGSGSATSDSTGSISGSTGGSTSAEADTSCRLDRYLKTFLFKSFIIFLHTLSWL